MSCRVSAEHNLRSCSFLEEHEPRMRRGSGAASSAKTERQELSRLTLSP
jgi:hypothetical protein